MASNLSFPMCWLHCGLSSDCLQNTSFLVSVIQMISNLTFKQENLIEDQPVVNLLRNMNEMLENLASTRRQSYGSNPLQQLVLIIGDGKFHEREKLKRSVRNFLQKKRMVVYLLLDDAEQSVLDLAVCPILLPPILYTIIRVKLVVVMMLKTAYSFFSLIRTMYLVMKKNLIR